MSWQDASTAIANDDRGDPLICPAAGCQYETLGSATMQIHIRRQHPTLAASPTPAPPKEDAVQATETTTEPDKPTLLPCDEPDCGRSFSSKLALSIHRAKAHGERGPRAVTGSDSPPSPEAPKSEPAPKSGDKKRSRRGTPQSAPTTPSPAARQAAAVLSAADALATSARRFLRLYAEMMASSVDAAEMENASWRLGAAIADYEDSRP